MTMNAASRTRWPRDGWDMGPRGVLALIVLLTIGLSACSSGSQDAAKTSKSSTSPAATSPVNTKAESVPTSLADAGEYGENVYDYAKARDWKNAEVKLAALKAATRRIRSEDVNKRESIDSLDGDVAALDLAVTAKDRHLAMRQANQVTLDVAAMSAGYKLSVPVEVTKLDYYGRELEIWAEAQDANKLQATARDMRRTWDALRSSVEAHDAAAARRFDALVAEVEGAKTPADHARLATRVLDEVDNLEKLFH